MAIFRINPRRACLLPRACLSICLSVCLSVCLSLCLFACLSVCLSVCLSAPLPPSSASESDGKARDSLQKLQLFRQFYVMVLTYIYFSRVIVFLLTATMPFHLQWLGQLCLEIGTL